MNEFGSSFLRRAERALFELEQGKQEIRDLSNPEHGTLELAVTTASTLPNILREFRKKQPPDIQFHVRMLATQEMVTLLQRGEVDFCLSSPPIEGDEPTRLFTLVEAEVGIAFIPSTARHAQDPITYLQIENHELVREIALLWHRSRYISRAALEFREVVVANFEAISKSEVE